MRQSFRLNQGQGELLREGLDYWAALDYRDPELEMSRLPQRGCLEAAEGGGLSDCNLRKI